MYKATAALMVLALSVPSHEQNTPPSPCPGVFEYQKTGSEPGKWEGIVYLTSDVPLYSLFLNIILDGKAQLLGNWLGEVSTNDNKEFRIETTESVIAPESPLDFKFYVRFDALSKTPLLQSIKFNGKEICNAAVPVENTSPPPAQPPATPKSTPPPSQPLLPLDTIETKPIKNPSDNSEIERPVYKPGPPIEIPTNIGGGEATYHKEGCGMVVSSTVLIREGLPTGEAEWPWHIALYLTEFTDNKFICGGTLVSYLHIITAAHCVTLKDSRQIVDIIRLQVLLGKHNLEGSVEGARVRFLSNVIIHDEYKPKWQQRDIAILTMQERVHYSRWIQPACLWPENLISLDHVINRIGIVVGWGHDGNKTSVSILNKVSTPVVDDLTCLKSLAWFFENYVSEYTYCGGFRNGSSPCNGDSGGGMMFKLGSAWYLRGLVSLAVADEGSICNPFHYIVFTDVAKFLPWIKSIITG